jgi:diketogulonate reductase-like aldo/keto reductase
MNLPPIGLGTYQLDPETTYSSVLQALSLGYRHIDTAALYRNEAAIGRALADSKIPRDEIWITTKIWTGEIQKGFEAMKRSVERSLIDLNVQYIDLVLLHNPTQHVEDDWHHLERIRHIGVSNYTRAELTRVLNVCTQKPLCNQIELSPFLARRDLVDFCRHHAISIVAHSPLTKGHKLNHDTLAMMARRYSCSPAVLMLSWARHKGFSVIPRSRQIEHLRENLTTVNLLDSDVVILDQLNEEYTTHPSCLYRSNQS